jgi:hypothetical protein
MKKILTIGLLALPTALITEQPASAWCNFKFGCGLNISWQSGGNNFLWGLFRSGQPPCSEGGFPGYPGYPAYNPNHYGPDEFQYFGYQQKNGNRTAPAQASPASTQPANNNHAAWNGNPAYQPVSYSAPENNPYYYYSSYPQSYYGYQVPSYWYGR